MVNTHLIKWKTKSHKHIVRSTCIAELLGLLEAVRAVKGLLLIYEEVKFDIKSITFYCDNKAAIDVVKNKKFSPAIKDCYLPELYLRQEFRSGRFQLEYIESSANTSDMFTKNVDGPTFIRHRNTLMKQVEDLH